MASRPANGVFELALVILLATSCSGDRPESADEIDRSAVIQDCEAIAKTFDRIRCLGEFAAQQGDRQICAESEDEFVRYQCYGLFAQRKDDLEACKLIPPDDPELLILHTACVPESAVRRDDVELCTNLERQSSRDACYLRFAEVSRDPEHCERIIDPALERDCRNEVQ